VLRFSAVFAFVIILSIYAYRDWFKSLCGLILLAVVAPHPDMPSMMFGIQGLNPWNMLALNVVMAWWVDRRREGRVWDMPRHVNVLLVLYGCIIVVGFFRMIGDLGDYLGNAQRISRGEIWGEYLINSIKWVVPGLLLFDGCRTRERVSTGLFCTLAVYVLLALLVIRWVPLGDAISGEAMGQRSLKLLVREIGYHRVNASAMLAGASWALVTALAFWKRRWALVLLAAAVVCCGQVLTGGRMGYVTWLAVGLAVGVLHRRKFLLLIPIVILGVTAFIPAAVERMMEGVQVDELTGEIQGYDDSVVTAGRVEVWPYIVERIQEGPLIGFGRQAMVRGDLPRRIWEGTGGNETGEWVIQPHDAYLEILLDNGLAGFVPVICFYIVVLWHAGRLLLSKDPTGMYAAAGGSAFVLVLALLIASLGSQTFYPREGAVGMWAAIGLMFRVSLMRQQAQRSIARHPPAMRHPIRAFRRLSTWPQSPTRAALPAPKAGRET
jgi:O-Antigen ligase